MFQYRNNQKKGGKLMKTKSVYKLFLLVLALLLLLTGCQSVGPQTVWCLTERTTTSDGMASPQIVQIRYSADGTPVECLAGPEGELVQVGLRRYDEQGNLVYYKNTYFDREETYDPRGNVLEKKSGGKQHRFAYDESDRMLSEEILDEKGKQLSLTEYTYDEKGNLILEARGWDGNVHTETRYTYDAQGNCLSMIFYQDGKPSQLAVSSTYEYDGKGNLIWQKNYLGGEPYGCTYTYTYDDQGNRLSFLQENDDGSAFESRYTFNEAGQETSFTDINRDEDGTEHIRYFYYTYDEWGNKCGQHDIDFWGEERKFLWVYDKNGNLLTESLETNGRMDYETLRTYDKNGNLLTEISDGKPDYSIVWTYDKEGRPLTYTSDFKGSSDGQETWEYDQNGNLIRNTRTYDRGYSETTTVITYSYTKMTLPADQAEVQREAQTALMEALNTSYVFAD